MSIINMKFLLVGAMALFLGGCGGEDSGAPSQPDGGNTGGSEVVITELQVTPANSRIPAGFEQQLVAQALMSDGSVTDVTANPSVNWSSGDPTIASVDDKGLVKGIKVGIATIKAFGTNVRGQAFEATAQVEITSATVTGLQVTPATASVPVGFTQKYVATALLSDGSALDVTQFTGLTWSSGDTATATISNETATKGHATGITAGTVTITASGSANGLAFSATAALTVTSAHVTALQVTPATATVPVGLTQQFTATAILSDGSARDVTHEPALSWVSSDTAVATISSGSPDKGLATGVAVGNSTITASGSAGGTPFTASATLTVTDAVATQLVVTPATTTTPAGLTKQFLATLTLSDGSTRDVTHEPALSWVSSDTAVATISSGSPDKGLATGVAVGSSTITASGSAGGTPFTASATLTVTDAVAAQLVVTPATTTTPAGLTKQFLATLTLSDGSTRDVTHEPALSWVSSDTAVATISSGSSDKGLATGVAVGSSTITASGSAGGTPFTASATLTVTDAVAIQLVVTPATTTTPAGLTKQFLATLTLSDGSTRDVTHEPALSWVSSDTAVATISSGSPDKGLATGVAVGNATITASGSAGGTPFTASATLTVTNAVVTALQVTPVTAEIAKGANQAFTAMATFSNGDILDVTNQAALSWMSSNVAIATITSSQPSGNGVATGTSSGTVTITASGSNNGTPFTATAQLTVKDAPGSVVTWGDSKGGDSSAVQSELINVRTIYGQGNAAAAVRQDGSVVTWGDATKGGDSTSVQGSLTNVQSITPAFAAFAALKQDGTVVSWGSADSGGDSTAVLDQLVNVQSIWGTDYAYAAIKQDGTVVTWGEPTRGGDSTVVTPDLHSVQSITSTWAAFAALRQDGSVITWGDPGAGGDSSAVQSQLVNVQAIYSTDFAFAALKQDGTVVTWGDATSGGDSSTAQGLLNVQTIVGASNAFAALKQDGTVVAWGNPGYGGDSSLVQSQLIGVQTIFSNSSAFAALKSDTTVVAWGASYMGGDAPAGLSNVATISAAYDSFAALKLDGTVKSWGAAGSSSPQPQMTNVKSITAGWGAYSALKQDGTVVAWGNYNAEGDSSAMQPLTNIEAVFSCPKCNYMAALTAPAP